MDQLGLKKHLNTCWSARHEMWALCQTNVASLGLKPAVDYVAELL